MEKKKIFSPLPSSMQVALGRAVRLELARVGEAAAAAAHEQRHGAVLERAYRARADVLRAAAVPKVQKDVALRERRAQLGLAGLALHNALPVWKAEKEQKPKPWSANKEEIYPFPSSLLDRP